MSLASSLRRRITRAQNWAPLAVCLGALLWTQAAHAVPPHYEWYTLETPHFRVHFHEGAHMYALAQRTARACEAAHALLAPRLRWTPRRKTEVILTDDVDSANGSAFAMYRPWMRLYAEAPEDQSVLNDYDDHLWNLVVHEYTHVLHLDTVYGLPEGVNTVFGKMLLPNAYVPRWMTEGLATWQESNLSNAGRLRSSLFEMWLRASILHRPFRLDEVSHTPHQWPRGNLAYLYGGQFLAHIADRVGEEAVPDLFALYGGRVVPWSLNDSAERVWDKDFLALYDDFLSTRRAAFEAQLAPVREAGVTKLQVLTRSGNSTGSPRLTPDGQRIVYVAAPVDSRPELRVMRRDGTQNRKVKGLWSTGPLDVSPDAVRVVISLPEVFEEYQTFDDLWEIRLEDGDLVRLSHGLRATDPAYSPDGRTIAFVGRSGGGHSYLGLYDRATGEVRRVLEADERARLFTPVFTPDGQSLVFSQKRGTGRRLGRIRLDGKGDQTLLEAEWLLLQPRFAKDGALHFAADRSGIYNLYALDPDTGALRQLTNVETGAFHPSPAPDGHLALLTYSHEGYDVAVLAPEDRFGGAPLPDRAPRPPQVWDEDPREMAPVRAYRVWPSVRPLYWLPALAADPLGPSIGLATGGADVLDRHLWSAQASFGLVSREPGLSLGYTLRTFHPGITTWAETYVSQVAGFTPGLYDRQWAAGFRMLFPASSLDESAALSIGYELRAYVPQFTPVLRPDQVRPLLPREGRAGTASLGFSWSDARGYAHSISPEEGQTLSATVRHSSAYTLGTFGFTSAEARAQKYVRLPWASHHVLAGQVLGGVGVGDLGDRPLFSLGGVGALEPILQLVNNQRVGSGVLRGYPSRVTAGNTLAFGSAEYRLPLSFIDRGPWSLPLFLRRLHAAGFVDAGATGRTAFTLEPLRVGTGAELRSDFVLGYYLAVQLRLGLARGLSREGVTQGYLTLGSAF